MKPRYTTSTPLDLRPQPVCEARRRHIFGPLLSMDAPAGEWPLWAGVALMLGMGIIGTLLVVAIGG